MWVKILIGIGAFGFGVFACMCWWAWWLRHFWPG